LQFTKEDIMRGVELAVMLILGIIVMLMVVRPLVRRIITPEAVAAITGGTAALETPEAVADEPITAAPSQTSKMIEIAQAQGQVHAQSVQKVGELADRNPNETISIIRQWLHNEAA